VGKRDTKKNKLKRKKTSRGEKKNLKKQNKGREN